VEDMVVGEMFDMREITDTVVEGGEEVKGNM